MSTSFAITSLLEIDPQLKLLNKFGNWYSTAFWTGEKTAVMKKRWHILGVTYNYKYNLRKANLGLERCYWGGGGKARRLTKGVFGEAVNGGAVHTVHIPKSVFGVK